jgi:hypothetical protein
MEERTVAYRGICLSEAMKVIEMQKYSNAEERKFRNDIETKAVFGPGVYLVSNYTVAAEYAYCHAEANEDKGCVISQILHLHNPMWLDGQFGEKELRGLALAWKYPDGAVDKEVLESEGAETSRWAGRVIRDYMFTLGYDGIVYEIEDDLTYYVAYQQDKQISCIQLDFVYELEEVHSCTFSDLRNKYQSIHGKTQIHE